MFQVYRGIVTGATPKDVLGQVPEIIGGGPFAAGVSHGLEAVGRGSGSRDQAHDADDHKRNLLTETLVLVL